MIAGNFPHFLQTKPLNIARPLIELTNDKVRELPQFLDDIFKSDNCLHDPLYVNLTYNSTNITPKLDHKAV